MDRIRGLWHEHGIPRRHGRGNVRVPHSQIDDILPRSPRGHLEVVHYREDIRGETLDSPKFHRFQPTASPVCLSVAQSFGSSRSTVLPSSLSKPTNATRSPSRYASKRTTAPFPSPRMRAERRSSYPSASALNHLMVPP